MINDVGCFFYSNLLMNLIIALDIHVKYVILSVQ
jgi:hypothetical protein